MEVETAVSTDNKNTQNPCSGTSMALNEAVVNMNSEPSTNAENNENLETTGNPLIQKGKLPFFFFLKSLSQ